MLLSKPQKNLIESGKKMFVDETAKKMNLKREEKNQASLGEPYKPELISQTCISLNCRPELN